MNFLFEEKQVSAFKLYCHLSDCYELLLMLLGTLVSLGARIEAPLICYLFGDMANNFTAVNINENQIDILK